MICYDKIFPLILAIILIKKILSKELSGNNIGAYIKTPNLDKLQYRLGSNYLISIDYHPNFTKGIFEYAGYNGMRITFTEELLEKEEENKKLDIIKKNNESSILDVIGVLTSPLSEHLTNKIDLEENIPKNLYEPIWLSDNSINTKNYWANYVYKAVSKYKDYIKIWEVWDSPDISFKPDNYKNWLEYPKTNSKFDNWKGTIFEYIRLLRITYEVAKK